MPCGSHNICLLVFSRLFMLQNALLQQEWRVTDLHHRLIKYLHLHLSHLYKNVRDRLGRYVTCKHIACVVLFFGVSIIAGIECCLFPSSCQDELILFIRF